MPQAAAHRKEPTNELSSAGERLRRGLEGVLGVPFTAGNRVQVLRNGDEIFPAMLEAIEGATESIEFLTFVYWKGDIARRFARTLAERARAGVEVRVLLDSFGARFMDDEVEGLMTDAGVEVRWFRPIVQWKLWETNHRTHRKILVVDGKVGFTGGVGIADEWDGDARNPNEWRETHFRIEGPAVHGIRGGFIGNWAELNLPVGPFTAMAKEIQDAGTVHIQTIRAVASIGWSDIATLNQAVIALANERIRISTAYFVPDERTIEELCAAARRGIQVEVIVPGRHHDERVSQLAGESTFRPLISSGVAMHYFNRTMFHAKIMTVDGELAVVGSANFNQRSMLKDDEESMVILDRDVVATLDQHFDEDLASCDEVHPQAWKSRGILQRGLELLSDSIRGQV